MTVDVFIYSSGYLSCFHQVWYAGKSSLFTVFTGTTTSQVAKSIKKSTWFVKSFYINFLFSSVVCKGALVVSPMFDFSPGTPRPIAPTDFHHIQPARFVYDKYPPKASYIYNRNPECDFLITDDHRNLPTIDSCNMNSCQDIQENVITACRGKNWMSTARIDHFQLHKFENSVVHWLPSPVNSWYRGS